MGDSKFSAAELWWPPLLRLHERLQELKADRDAQGLQDLLRDYEPCLAQGLRHFRGPSAASRKAIEGEASLSIGAKKLPVEAPLRQEAFALSSLLVRQGRPLPLHPPAATRPGFAAGSQAHKPPVVPSPQSLDEVQAYVLLRRWLAQQKGIALGKETLVLAPEHRRDVAAFYAHERSNLLKSTEELLWLGERETGILWNPRL